MRTPIRSLERRGTNRQSVILPLSPKTIDPVDGGVFRSLAPQGPGADTGQPGNHRTPYLFEPLCRLR
jgi:hypothetical protein